MRNDPDFAPLVEALDRQVELYDDVKRLTASTRKLALRTHIQTGLIIGLVIVLVAIIGIAVNNRTIAKRANEAADHSNQALAQLEDLVHRQDASNDKIIFESCKVRNGANKGTRQQFRHSYFLIMKLGPIKEQSRAFIKTLIDDIPTAQEQDRDCNGDRKLTKADYPD